MDYCFKVRLDFKIKTEVPVFSVQCGEYPSYKELMELVVHHANKTEIPLDYFEKNALIIIEESIANLPFNQEIFSIDFRKDEPV